MYAAPPQPQITVPASATAGSAAPAAAAVSAVSVAISAPTQPVLNALSLSQYESALVPVRTTPPVAARPSVTAQPAPRSGDSTVPAFPNEAVVTSEEPTITPPAAITTPGAIPTPPASTTPPANTTSATVRTRPDRGAKHTANPPDVAAASPTVQAVSLSARRPQPDAVPGGCGDSEPLVVAPRPTTSGEAQRGW